MNFRLQTVKNFNVYFIQEEDYIIIALARAAYISNINYMPVKPQISLPSAIGWP
jgi:hypothetical protein